MNTDSFLTIQKPSEGLYKEKGSKFLSFTYPVESEEQIKDVLDNLHKSYHDARHYCYAYRLGADMMQYRFNDDGEPSNTAGKPILGQIKAKNLTNVLVVVIRYFGGTLLGVGGLIQAYKAAAKDALDNSLIIRKHINLIYQISFSYPEMNVVMKILKDLDAEQFEQKFEMECSLKARIKKKTKKRFEKAFFPYHHKLELEFLGEE